MWTWGYGMKIIRVVCNPSGEITEPSCMICKEVTIDETVLQNKSEVLSMYSEQHQQHQIVMTQLGWELRKRQLTQYEKNQDVQVVKTKTADGEKSIVAEGKEIGIGSTYEGTVQFQISPEEYILGLGQHENGIANYRECETWLYQNNMQIPMPVFLSTAGYGVLFDAQCMMRYQEKKNQITISFCAVDFISYYVIMAENLHEVVKGIRKLTGKAELLPRWAYGYIQSRERYTCQDELVRIKNEFCKRNIPVSCLVQDWMTWEDGKWGNKRLDKQRFYDLHKVVDDLHENGIGFLFSVWPNMNEGVEDQVEMKKAGKLYANQTIYDAFDEAARNLYWQQCEREIFAAGTDGWWCDSSEPFTPDWEGRIKKSDEERFELAKKEFEKYIDARKANAYALFHAKGIYENQRRVSGNKRVVNLTRSGYPSIQRYGTILWSGDIMATWEVFRKQIMEGLQMSASGIPYWTLDIGAFFVGKNKKEGETTTQLWFWDGDYELGVKDKGYCELYTRWLQYGTFLPIMRSHGTDTPREPWFFEEAGTVYFDTITKYIKMRYELIPYIYSMAYQVYEHDAMMMRSLVFDYAQDEQVYAITDQYMFGDFMVCPVVTPMEYGPNNTVLGRKQTREVYLPKGTVWYGYEDKNRYDGGSYIEADAPISKMPVYVRAGSILFLEKAEKYDLYHERELEEVIVEIYEGDDGVNTLYWDEGNGYAYQDEKYCAIEMKWLNQERTLMISEIKGNAPYPQMLHVRLICLNGKIEEKEELFCRKSVVFEKTA